MINKVRSGDVLAALSKAFPEDPPKLEVLPEYLIPQEGDEFLFPGMVLLDNSGSGLLQPVGKPKPKTELDLILAQLREMGLTDA